jgi:hypothetical protein
MFCISVKTMWSQLLTALIAQCLNSGVQFLSTTFCPVFSLLRRHILTVSGAHLAQWVLSTPSPGLKQLEREEDHSSMSSAEIKIKWSYTSTPPCIFTAWCLGRKTILLLLRFCLCSTSV